MAKLPNRVFPRPTPLRVVYATNAQRGLYKAADIDPNFAEYLMLIVDTFANNGIILPGIEAKGLLHKLAGTYRFKVRWPAPTEAQPQRTRSWRIVWRAYPRARKLKVIAIGPRKTPSGRSIYFAL